MFRRIAFMVAVMIGLGATTASAGVIGLNSTLNGANEVHDPTSPGSGSAALSFDTITNQLDWDISWINMSSAVTAAHFHMAPQGQNGGVQVNIGAISGLNSPTIGNAILTAQQAADLLAGLWYINVHTATNLPGEIRGQVLLNRDQGGDLPAPAALTFILFGMGGLSVVRRKKSLA